MRLGESIEVLSNIGETRHKQLNQMGIESINDLIEYIPRDYEDRSSVNNIAELRLGEVCSVAVRVDAKPEVRRAGRLLITVARISDNTGSAEAVWYNQGYIKSSLKVGAVYVVTGKAVQKFGRVQIEVKDFELYNEYSLNSGRIVPMYRLPAKLSQKIFRSVVKQALDGLGEELADFMPRSITEGACLCDRAFALHNIHFPRDNKAFFEARHRLVFEELFMLQMRLLQLKGDVEKRESKVRLKDYGADRLLKSLGFELTGAQKRAIREALVDIRDGKVMNRLVQGDVGCGKTAVAQVLAYIMANNGYQSVLMAPTDVLAKQHYEGFCRLFEHLGISVALLTSEVKGKQRKATLAAIESGEVNIIIGTHAVIQESVVYHRLGLAITDEQHRFGVRQRQALSVKGAEGGEPHILVMTATPIPRTLALILYGDLDISVVDELPPGREKVDTCAVTTGYYQRLYTFIKKQVQEGGQCYIICPMIEEGSRKELRSVLSYTEELRDIHLKGLRVECVHGKMKGAEKSDIMSRFASGEVDVLVSTTVIEVGINVPNASLMVIENAERFGLSALHQLRGRVGRGKRKSWCVLVSDSKTEVAQKRLGIMCKTNDGFVISEKDLELRGPGDFFGTRQHGLPEMKIANLYKDVNVLKEVQQAAIDLYKADENLLKSENKLLKLKIQSLFEEENKKICL
jgi:ATP-dependent DNA helicase RecG